MTRSQVLSLSAARKVAATAEEAARAKGVDEDIAIAGAKAFQ